MSYISGNDYDSGKFVKDVAKTIVGCFSESELRMLSEVNANGLLWSFGEQIMDFYCSQYPSLATVEDIEMFINDRVKEYRPVMNSTNVNEVKEMFLEEFEGGVFASPETNVWNREMVKNLEISPNVRISAKVVWAVDLVVAFISSYSRDIPYFEFGGKMWSLRECLLARWCLSILGCSKREFENRLNFLYLLTDKSPSEWNPDEGFSTVKLHAFLAEIDILFLYPHPERDTRKIFGILDTGRNIGFFNMLRFVKSFGDSFSYLTIATFIVICLCAVIWICVRALT